MANKLVKRRYNNLLTARNNYFGNGGFELPPVDTSKMLVGNSIDTALASLSKAQPIAIPNPDPYKNAKVNKGMSKGMSGALSVLGPIVGQVGGNAISGGLESGAGSLISGLSGIASAIPGPWGAVASAGLGLIGGLTNRMFGSKMNTENIAKVEANINSLNNFQSDAILINFLFSNAVHLHGMMAQKSYCNCCKAALTISLFSFMMRKYSFMSNKSRAIRALI